MCGIVGIVGNFENRDEVLKKMNDLIVHRGPDEDGFFSAPDGALAMRRLSIIDLKTGKQPISSLDGNYTIVFNGEIYNYKILKLELVKKGFVFKTDTDTEVLLNLYIDNKETMLTKLRGMFAFAIFNKNDNTIFVARDYFGIKPLYFIKNDEKILAFGSEIKSLLAHPAYYKEVNDEAVYNYLFFQYNPIKETFFKNIFKLLPGHYMKINLNDDSFEEKKYWSFQYKHEDISLEDGKKELKELLKNSVAAHMIADVPVASFLSGGIDSGIIATMASDLKKESGEKLSTFTIGFEEMNEWSKAKEVAKEIGSAHHEVKLDWKKYFNALPKIIWHLEEPVADPSAISLYFLAQEASKEVKVVLSGEGADELFGGYNTYLEPFALGKIRFIPLFIRKIIFSIVHKIYPKMYGMNFLERSILPVENRYIGCGSSIFSERDVHKIWNGKNFNRMNLNKYYDQVKDFSDSEKMEFVDINVWLAGDILAKADKMTMANSLELRVPFLDIEISNFASKLKGEMKWHEGETKYLLREAVKDVVPETTRKREKLGFPTPINLVIKENLSEIEKIISNNNYIKEHFNQDLVGKILSKNHANPEKKNFKKTFLLLMLATWYEEFFGNM